MPLTLSTDFRPILHPLFQLVPLDQSMRQLVVSEPLGGKPAELVEQAASHPLIEKHPELLAGLWLYVDDLDRSHALSQSLHSPTGSFWHAIMHRREGDFSNAKYWYQKVGTHPAMSRIDLTGGGAGSGTDVAAYDPFSFVDRVAKAHEKGGRAHPALISEQHREWRALFEWCVEQAGRASL
jgi:hypothetical protein